MRKYELYNLVNGSWFKNDFNVLMDGKAILCIDLDNDDKEYYLG